MPAAYFFAAIRARMAAPYAASVCGDGFTGTPSTR